MANDIRIPPAVSLAFERIAYKICELAKLDHDEWQMQVHELRTHLQERWKEGIELGLSTEKAEERALVLFGSPQAIAKSLRKPLFTRLLTYKRFRSERLLTFLAAFVFYSWLQVLDVHYRAYLNDDTVELSNVMLPFSWQFFTDGLGTFFIGLIAVLSVVVIQWQPANENKWSGLFVARYVLFIGIALAIIDLAVKPSYLTWQTFQIYESYLFYNGYCVLHILAMLLGWLGVACLSIELLARPGQLSAK